MRTLLEIDLIVGLAGVIMDFRTSSDNETPRHH